jgi:putative lipoic acid-binding regulatory protein
MTQLKTQNMNVKNTVREMTKLQLIANMQFEVLGYVKPELMDRINNLAKDFDIFDHMTVMMLLEGHYGEVEIMVHTD